MIRIIFACCLALSFGAHPAIAQHMSTFNWGYLYAQKVVFDKQRNGLPSSVYLRWNAFSATYESFGPE